ncbi:uncharacterized protein AKAW2_12099A [Aspergillus luchuensis]|uniref:Uncharacterized protein n=1 Tax=Aspergillus kawachii TaxID=1069201 RepID=A0A7R7W281_ASPKA|nr:uncharacterized protein AKAW2_12099A [Aspergillus luchuensis]BCR95053.1 hypothetical protein AKAW2_12099A [Aspergillus luchuensis]
MPAICQSNRLLALLSQQLLIPRLYLFSNTMDLLFDLSPDEQEEEDKLRVGKYDEEDCKAAIQGIGIPKTFDEEVHRLCTIRGIRHHYGFAQELRGTMPEFTRALNARDIMSGVIPTMASPEEVPYCIWYPDVPAEGTLRALVQRYPDMLYHVARACAVAGYATLYMELDPVPEVHIAEEAGYASMQRGSSGSQQIYQHIMSQRVKFEIMNDYTRTVNINARQIASLNGDTAVYASLTARTKVYGPRDFKSDPPPWNEFCRDPPYFNITEDWGIDDHDDKAPEAPEDYLPLVYNPLPTDLPFINKDKLIHVAAYNGEIDRYARLRRPHMLKHEWAMVVHGIYHNPIFAKWWSTQIPEHPQDKHEINIRRAINARRIMSNDLSWLTPNTPGKLLPDLIWFPKVADATTYEKLAHRRPDMFEECLRACIVARYTYTWDALLRAAPELFKEQFAHDSSKRGPKLEDPKLWWLTKHARHGLWMEATASPNKHFQTDILAAVPDAAEKLDVAHPNSDWWGDYFVASELYLPHRSPIIRLHDPVQPGARDEGPYDGMNCGIGDVDIALFLGDAISKETWKREVLDEGFTTAYLEDVWDMLDTKQSD